MHRLTVEIEEKNEFDIKQAVKELQALVAWLKIKPHAGINEFSLHVAEKTQTDYENLLQSIFAEYKDKITKLVAIQNEELNDKMIELFQSSTPSARKGNIDTVKKEGIAIILGLNQEIKDPITLAKNILAFPKKVKAEKDGLANSTSLTTQVPASSPTVKYLIEGMKGTSTYRTFGRFFYFGNNFSPLSSPVTPNKRPENPVIDPRGLGRVNQ